MVKKAFRRVYTRIDKITKATCSLRAENVGFEELALIDGRLAQIVKIIGNEVTLQVFAGTEGIPTDAEVIFLGHPPALRLGPDIIGRFLNAYGDPIDGGPKLTGQRARDRRSLRESGKTRTTVATHSNRYCRH